MTSLARADQNLPLAELLLGLLHSGGVRDVVIAPGSRSAPLTLAAVRHGGFRARLVYDERSAAYTALGIAQQSGLPTAVICSSGTAALNFAPAVAEAYYQQLPLLCLTADRPPEWIDQIDNQALHQTHAYGDHVRAAFNFPVDDGAQDTRWHAARIINDALALLAFAPRGPVQINVPLREPLYRTSLPAIAPESHLRRPVVTLPTERTLSASVLDGLAQSWRTSPRKLIIVGQHAPDARLRAALQRLRSDPGVVVIGDSTSNLQGDDSAPALRHWEAALYARAAGSIQPLLPDLAIWLGGQVTSKAIKTLLRLHPPQHFWRVAPDLPAADAFQANTVVIPVSAPEFLSQLAEALALPPLAAREGVAPTQLNPADPGDYASVWRSADAAAAALLDDSLRAAPFSELTAVQKVLTALPPQGHLQIGNSMAIRLVNLLGVPPTNTPARIDSNRGVSGIDGTVSTAVGAALTTEALTTLLVGDLGFFYDRNGLWQNPLPVNLRIVLLNNHGGGIFDVIDGPDTLAEEERRPWFLTPNPLRAERTAADFGLHYLHADDAASLTHALQGFFQPSTAPVLLEIETEMRANSALWRATLDILRARASAPGSDSPHDDRVTDISHEGATQA